MSDLNSFDRWLFGTRLREAREKNGWTQAELALRTGLRPSAISHFEVGRRSPSTENLWRLLFVLKVPAEWILGLKKTGKEME